MNKPEYILLWGSNIWLFADGMLGPLFSIFSQQKGGNIFDITWAWAIYLGCTGIFVMIVGNLSDRISKEKLLVTGYALTALCTFGYLLVESPFQLFLVQAGLGLALGLCNPTWFALYDKHMPPKRRGYAWGLEDGLGKILVAVAILLGGFIVEQYSFQTLFITMGTIQIIATLYMAQILMGKKSKSS